jgi:hypothetical protein
MPADRIARTKIVDGRVTPAIIHNSSYFFVNLQIYADGLVNCWELVDLQLFREKLRSGWVVSSIPDGKAISVHGLGDWTIADGRWSLDANAMYEHVVSVVRELNPRMENLHDFHERTTEPRGTGKVSILGSAPERPVRLSGPESWFAKRIPGDRLSVFIRDDDYYLCDLRAFADGVIELGRLPDPETVDLAGLQTAVERGRVVSTVPSGARVRIHGLGSFVAVQEQWSADIREQLREVHDIIEKANGRPTSIERCCAAYDTYMANPSDEAREALRIAYEAVPEHNRRYVGDMDIKDIAVRMIVYGDEEIEGWSHRAVARARGLPLPEIKVPRPKKG